MSRGVYLMFQLMGSGILLGGLYMGVRSLDFRLDSVPYAGEVVDNETRGNRRTPSYHAIVAYKDAGGETRHMRSAIGSRPPAYGIGEKVTVRAAADGRVRIDSFTELWVFPVALAGFGLLFMGVGFGPAFLRARSAKRLAFLKRTGESVVAERVEVVLDKTYRVNRRHPYYLRCHAQVEGAEREFRSGPIWEDPAAAVAGRPIRIWYLPRRPDQYRIDLEFLEAPDAQRDGSR